MKRLSFITQFKIEFSLPFTSYRKMLGKMPVMMINCFSGMNGERCVELKNSIYLK